MPTWGLNSQPDIKSHLLYRVSKPGSSIMNFLQSVFTVDTGEGHIFKNSLPLLFVGEGRRPLASLLQDILIKLYSFYSCAIRHISKEKRSQQWLDGWGYSLTSGLTWMLRGKEINILCHVSRPHRCRWATFPLQCTDGHRCDHRHAVRDLSGALRSGEHICTAVSLSGSDVPMTHDTVCPAAGPFTFQV